MDKAGQICYCLDKNRLGRSPTRQSSESVGDSRIIPGIAFSVWPFCLEWPPIGRGRGLLSARGRVACGPCRPYAIRGFGRTQLSLYPIRHPRPRIARPRRNWTVSYRIRVEMKGGDRLELTTHPIVMSVPILSRTEVLWTPPTQPRP